MPNEVTQGVSNYLVPATGSPNAYVIKNTFTASPQSVNFQNIQLNGLAFRPSGVIIDNTKSASPLNVLIPEMSFNISCPAGASLNMPYPAPMNHTASITGAGDAEATVIFVDYPLQPYSSAQAAGSPPIPNPLPVSVPNPLPVSVPNPLPVSVPNPLPVSGPATDAEMRATPIPVSGPITNAEFRTSTDTFNVAVTSSTAIGTTAAAYEVSFLNSGTVNATVGGGPLPPNFVLTFCAPIGALINPISYNATGTTLNISTTTKV